MSSIFSGISRLGKFAQQASEVGGENLLEKVQIEFTPFSGRTRELWVTQVLNTSEQVDQDVKLFTYSQEFVEQSSKQYVLENIVFFTPRVFLSFRPEYSTQLATRYIIRLISGCKSNDSIDKILQANPGIAKYLKVYHALVCFVYKGGLVTDHMLYDEISHQVLNGLLEQFNIIRNESDIPCITGEQLSAWGDTSFIFDSKNTECLNISRPVGLLERPNTRELCMFSLNYACIVCKTYFNMPSELKLHISVHDVFECLSCELVFNNYTDLASHTVTFCKSTILLPNCEFCGEKSDACICIKLQKLVFNVIYKFLKKQGEDKIFTSDFFSTVFHAYCLKAIKPNLAFDRSALVGAPDEIEWTEDKVEVILLNYLAEFSSTNQKLTSVVLDYEDEKLSVFKQVHEEYFSDYHETRMCLYKLRSI